MRLRLSVDIVMGPCELDGVIVSWCPQLDVMSQGHGHEAAFFMCLDACQMMIAHGVSGQGGRVIHPLRSLYDGTSDEEDIEKEWRAYTTHPTRFTATEWNKLRPDRIAIASLDIHVLTAAGSVFVQMQGRFTSPRVRSRAYIVKLLHPAEESVTFVELSSNQDPTPENIRAEIGSGKAQIISIEEHRESE